MRFLAILTACAMLSGCGVVYTVPSVSDGSVFGDQDTGFDVKIVRMTPETTIAANLEEYIPARLPAAFQPASADSVAKTAPSGSTSSGRFPPLNQPRPYLLGVGDVVLLAVNAGATLENLPDLITAQSKRQGFIVQDDGAIAVPDVGRVRVADLTLADAEAEVFQAMLAAGIDPQFTMEIAEFNSQRVAVGGEVGNPSLVPITLKPLFLHEAVQLAGGARVLDPMVARVQLTRLGQTYSIPMERFNTDPAAKRIVLQDGDSVFVGLDTRDQQTERDVFKDRLELGAVERHYAYMTGEIRVSRKFELPFERTATLADILFDATLISIQTADYEEIYVIRVNQNPSEAGGIVAYNLDASNAVNLALAGQFEMRHNDIVFIAEQPITSWNRVISQLIPNLLLSTANIVATGL
ncbi:MAG: polysaccharide biosynthesis/export family protein [Pseudomonadota bacterium]